MNTLPTNPQYRRLHEEIESLKLLAAFHYGNAMVLRSLPSDIAMHTADRMFIISFELEELPLDDHPILKGLAMHYSDCIHEAYLMLLGQTEDEFSPAITQTFN
jgi:hypothetical protein